jgi:hypothetical protein
MAKTHVKEFVDGEARTFKDGKPRDKRIEIMVTFLSTDDPDTPSLLFGLKSSKFIYN